MSETKATAGKREWSGLAVLGLVTFIIGMDGTVLHLAVPHLSVDLRPTSAQLLWITDIYGFLIAGFLVTMGTIGDRIGRRRLLMIGGVAFGVASAVAAFSPTAEALIAARALLGVAGATLMPSTLSLIRAMFHDARQRSIAIAVWMTNFMLGGAVGPLVGGVLLAHFWWGSVFLIAVPVMTLLVVLGTAVLPEYKNADAGRLDPPSVLLSLGAILPLVYGMKHVASDGFSWLVVAAFGIGAGLGVLFVRRQRRLTQPLVDLALFARRAFSVSVTAQTVGLFVLAGTQFLLLQYLQLVVGLSPLAAGVWVVPVMVVGVLGMLSAPMLARHVGYGRSMTALFLLSLPGFVLIVTADAGSGPLPVIAGFAVLNLTINPVTALANDLIIATAPAERAGAASGVSETGTELGLAGGVAVMGSVSVAVYRDKLTDLPGGIPARAADTVRETLGGAVDVAERLGGGAGAELAALAHEAFTAGLQLTAVLGGVVVAGLAVLSAVLLRQVRGDVS